MDLYYDRQGQPITLDEWLQLGNNLDYKRVARTEVAPDVVVSTVWLGLDHGWGEGPPVIFETMVFGGPLDQEQWRYATEGQAVDGHGAVVGMVRKALHWKEGTT